MNTKEENNIIDYLQGRLSVEDRHAFEARIMADAKFAKEVELAKEADFWQNISFAMSEEGEAYLNMVDSTKRIVAKEYPKLLKEEEKRKKRLIWSLTILIILGIAAWLYFRPNLSTTTTQPQHSPKPSLNDNQIPSIKEKLDINSRIKPNIFESTSPVASQENNLNENDSTALSKYRLRSGTSSRPPNGPIIVGNSAIIKNILIESFSKKDDNFLALALNEYQRPGPNVNRSEEVDSDKSVSNTVQVMYADAFYANNQNAREKYLEKIVELADTVTITSSSQLIFYSAHSMFQIGEYKRAAESFSMITDSFMYGYDAEWNIVLSLLAQGDETRDSCLHLLEKIQSNPSHSFHEKADSLMSNIRRIK